MSRLRLLFTLFTLRTLFTLFALFTLFTLFSAPRCLPVRQLPTEPPSPPHLLPRHTCSSPGHRDVLPRNRRSQLNVAPVAYPPVLPSLAVLCCRCRRWPTFLWSSLQASRLLLTPIPPCRHLPSSHLPSTSPSHPIHPVIPRPHHPTTPPSLSPIIPVIALPIIPLPHPVIPSPLSLTISIPPRLTPSLPLPSLSAPPSSKPVPFRNH